jgi:hypothetical protein
LKKKRPSFAKASEGEGGAGGSNFVDPLASVLQISAAIYLTLNGFFFYHFAYQSKLSSLRAKIKTTSLRKWQRLLDRGAYKTITQLS